MPLYEYDCRTCGCESEILVRGSEAVACPQCGSAELARRLSVPAAPVANTGGSAMPVGGGCGIGPPCGAPHCGRLPK
jgi:putative FmdB family regulatory protein